MRDLIFYILLSLSGFLIHGISEYNWLISLYIYYFVLQILSLGVLLRADSDKDNKNSGNLQSRVIFSTSALLIIIIGIALSKYNQIIIDKVPKAQSLEEMEKQLNQAKILCERCGVPYYLSGFANLNEVKKLQNSNLIDKAQQAFDQVIDRNPYNSKVYMTQGDLFLFQRKNQEAKRSYHMAMRDSRYKEIARKKLKSLEKMK